MTGVVRFQFVTENGKLENEIFVQMKLPNDPKEREEYLLEMKDGTASYIESVRYSPWTLARDVAGSFDPDAKIIDIPTIKI